MDAPWNAKVVTNLKKRQENSDPYICECGEVFVPKKRGFICKSCDNIQTWCYDEDASGEFLRDIQEAKAFNRLSEFMNEVEEIDEEIAEIVNENYWDII